MISKLANWRQRYDALMTSAQTTPFKWFEHDCVTFAAKVLDAQYDLNLMAYIEHNLWYNDQDSAIEMIEGYGSLEALVTEALGVEPLPPGHLTVGDIALYAYDAYAEFPFALAVHDGHQLLAPAAEGLTFLHLGRALKGWRP